MGVKAHRAVKLARGEIVAGGGGLRVSIGGRGRALYRELRVKLRAADNDARTAAKKAYTYDPLAEHQTVTREYQALGQMVRDRVREPFDLYKFMEQLGPYTPVAFQPSEFVPSPHTVKQHSILAYPMKGWVTMVAIGIPAALLLLEEWWLIAGVTLVLGTAGPMAIRLVRQRPGYAVRLEEKMRKDFAEEQVRLRAAHVRAEEQHRTDRIRDEGLRVRLRESFGSRNPAPLTEVLELQLMGQGLPLPVIFDVDFDGFESAAIDLILPELDDMPEELTSITHSGRLARKKLERPDRCVLYDEACCGLALRLVAETFCLLPMLPKLTLRGIFTTKDSTGREVDRAGLTIDVRREDFAGLNLTAGAAPDLVRQIGKWGGNRKGEISMV